MSIVLLQLTLQIYRAGESREYLAQKCHWIDPCYNRIVETQCDTESSYIFIKLAQH